MHFLQIWELTAAKRMKTDLYCRQRNCSTLNVLLSGVQITLISQGVTLLGGYKQGWCGKTSIFELNVSISRKW